MATQTLAVVLVLIAAAVEALSNVLQHKAANSSKREPGHSEAGAVLRTLKKPLFLLGFALMIVGYGFHVASLGFGVLAVIQVIFVTQLVFVLPFSKMISKTHISRSDWAGAAVVTLGIAAFVAVAQPTAGDSSAAGMRWLVAIGAVSLACLIVVVLGYRMHGATRAALIGVSGGLINGLVAPLTKGTIQSASNGVGALFTSWFIWVTLIAALLGVLFPLMAFRAGPITASFPAVMSLNPIVATILGVYLFGETLATSTLGIVLMVLSGIVIFVGIVWLSRSKAIAEAFEEHEDNPGEASATATLL
ncbi:MAG: DMT family transporter [Actinomycetes bacterium]